MNNYLAINTPLLRLKYVIEYKRKDPVNKVADYFQTEYKKLVRYVRNRIDDAADRDAEDIVQDVVLNIFNKSDISIPSENLTA